jgi:cytochrome c oxidase subunit 4
VAAHIVPRRTYYLIFVTLLALTYVTVQVSAFDLGPLNTVAALGIAGFKALLVALFFMHLKYSTRVTLLAVAAGIYWLGILLALTLSDYVTRSWGRFG